MKNIRTTEHIEMEHAYSAKKGIFPFHWWASVWLNRWNYVGRTNIHEFIRYILSEGKKLVSLTNDACYQWWRLWLIERLIMAWPDGDFGISAMNRFFFSLLGNFWWNFDWFLDKGTFSERKKVFSEMEESAVIE